MSYEQFIRSKTQHAGGDGFEPKDLPPWMYDFQAHLTTWACRRGVGCELKPSYYRQAVRNLASLQNEKQEDQLDLFATTESEVM